MFPNALIRSLYFAKQQTRYLPNYLYWKKLLGNADVVFLGPWLGEVGPELQYWIPYLIKIHDKGFFGNKNLIAISRGGVGLWYRKITAEYVELFDYISSTDFKAIRSRAFDAYHSQKQIKRIPLEDELIEKIAQKLGLRNYAVVHPSFMWKYVVAWLQERVKLETFNEYFEFNMFSNEDRNVVNQVDSLSLPKKYIVLNFYSNQLFPHTTQNQKFINELVKKLTVSFHLVWLSQSSRIDDHEKFNVNNNKKLIKIGETFQLKENLALQTEVVRRSSLFIGTNGGFTILPGFLQVPCIAIYSNCPSHYYSIHTQHERVTNWIYNKFGVQYSVVEPNLLAKIVF